MLDPELGRHSFEFENEDDGGDAFTAPAFITTKQTVQETMDEIREESCVHRLFALRLVVSRQTSHVHRN